MNDWSGHPRSPSQIKRDLELRRSELREDMDLFFRGRRSRDDALGAEENTPTPPDNTALSLLAVVAAGAVIGFLVFRRNPWPVRVAGRVFELAAPAMLPVLVHRVLGRE